LRGSIALRGWRSTLTRIAEELRQRPEMDQSLSLLSLDEYLKPFSLPSSDNDPRVSVIIPVHGKLPYTLTCLRSLAQHGAKASFEVIVVDDASPDNTASELAQIKGLILLRNKANLGFIGSCNAGAAVARGEYLHFLNNDTQLTPGWLDALLDCFAEEADCGLAGSRLVYPDGRLQEAGALVFADGSCWNIGRFEAHDQPSFRFRRPVDYVSGASLLIPRTLFEQTGGFDLRYAPAYYEDTDLAFKVRQLGYKVYYEPRSMVIHFEGISAGTDLDAGMKQYQRRNQSIFAEKWSKELTSYPRPGTSLKEAMQRLNGGRILIVDNTVPHPQRDSGSLRLCEMFRLLHADGYSLSFMPDDGYCTGADIDALGALGVEVLCRPWIKDLPDWLRQHGKYLDAVILCRHTVAGQYSEIVRRHAPQASLIFDTVDLHFLREQRAADLTGRHAMQRQASASRQNELALIRNSDVSFVVSSHEQVLLKQLVPEARVELLSNIHRVYGRGTPHAKRGDVVFIGGYGHPPNADAIQWIAQDILPSLRRALPELSVHVLGDIPDEVRQSLQHPGLMFHGRVDELAPWFDRCIASIAPLRFGAGVKGKINMSMSHGLPVIATDMAVEGMHLEDGKNVLLANEPSAFTSAVIRLQQDEALWLSISDASIENVKHHFSPATALATLRKVLHHSDG
jgi:O-antigen biosynthesis protein